MAGNNNPSSGKRGLAVVAVIVLLLGFGFGALKISHGIRAYRGMPSDEEMAGRQEFIRLLEELRTTLEEAEDPNALNADELLAERLQGSSLTPEQREDLRVIYRNAVEDAKGGPLKQETVNNMLVRELITAMNMADQEDMRRQLRNSLTLGGAGIGISAVIAGLLFHSAGKKKDPSIRTAPESSAAAPAEDAPDVVLYNEKEHE